MGFEGPRMGIKGPRIGIKGPRIGIKGPRIGIKGGPGWACGCPRIGPESSYIWLHFWFKEGWQ